MLVLGNTSTRSRAGLASSSGGGSSSSSSTARRAPPPPPLPLPPQSRPQSFGLEALRALLSETQQQRQSRIMRSAADAAHGGSSDPRAASAALRDALLSSDMMQHMARMSSLFGLDAPDGGLAPGLSDAMMGGLGFGGRFGGGLSYEQLVNLEDVKVCVPAAVLDSLPRRHVAAKAAAAAGDGGAAAGDSEE
jgi:hypothetical protein